MEAHNLQRYQVKFWVVGEKLESLGRDTGFRKIEKYGARIKEIGKSGCDIELSHQPTLTKKQTAEIKSLIQKLHHHNYWIKVFRNRITKNLEFIVM